MSGICDTCRREPCHMRFDGCKTCDVYEGGETRFEKLFGTPERAAQTLTAIGGRYPCDKGAQDCETCPLNGAPCRLNRDKPEESKLLEWLRGDA